MILYAWRRTTSVCWYCGRRMQSCIATGRQRCTNDCASGLGSPPVNRLRPVRGFVRIGRMTVPCDGVVGHFLAKEEKRECRRVNH